MRGAGRFLVLGVLWAAGCADETFDMLPNKAAAPDKSSGGSDSAGAPAAGRAGAGRSGSGGRGGTGGRGGAGGMGGAAAKGGVGTGGTGLVNEGGAADQPACGFSGCDSHCAPGVYGCFDCQEDADCASPSNPSPNKAFCSQTHGCVECRPTLECPKQAGCDTDCGMGDRCDYKTYTCKADCSRDQRACTGGLVCDAQRDVCVECTASTGCPYGLYCSLIGTCVECITSSNCQTDPQRPVCDSGACRSCRDTSECNPQGTPASFYRTCDRDHGTCNLQTSP